MNRTHALLISLLLATVAVAQEPGLHERTLEVAGVEREYLLYVPAELDATEEQPAPLVLMLHGRGSDMKAAASDYYGWRALSDREGFVVVFPNAVGRPRSWRPAWGRKSADAPFLAGLIDEVTGELPIDTDRVFMTGHSSGGIMSFSFAASHSGRVAAIGPVAGTIGAGRVTIPEPEGPVPVIAIHGMADRIVPYDKERGKNAAYASLLGAPASAAFWAKHNGCDSEPERTTSEDGKLHVDLWSGGEAGCRVELHSIEGGSHGWPGSRRGQLRAAEVIWAFFAEHARPAAAKDTEAAGEAPRGKRAEAGTAGVGGARRG